MEHLHGSFDKLQEMEYELARKYESHGGCDIGGLYTFMAFTSRDCARCHIEKPRKVPLCFLQRKGKKITIVIYTNNSSLLFMVKSYQNLNLPK